MIRTREGVAVIAGAVLLFLVLFAFAPPGTVFGDGAELTYAVSEGSVIHPPGYPLYRLLAGVLVFAGSTGAGLAIGAFSALFGCLTVSVFYLFLRRRGIDVAVCASTAFVLAVAFPVWDLSLKPEVYTLAAFIFVSTLFFWDLVIREQTGRLVLWFIVGLSLTHHPLAVLNLVLAVHATWRTLPSFKPSEAFALVSPLGLYLLLIIPLGGFPFNWPEIARTSELINHVLGGSFGRFFWLEGVLTPVIQWGRYLAAHLVAFPFVLLGIAGLGYVTIDRDLLPVVGLQLMFLFGLSVYGVPDIRDFLFPSYIVTGVALAYGFRSCARRGTRVTLITVGLILASYGGLNYLMAGTLRYDWSTYRYPDVYATRVDRRLQSGVVLSDWAHYSVLRYYQLSGAGLASVHLLSPTHRFNRWSTIGRFHHDRHQSVYVTIRNWNYPDDIQLLEQGPIYRLRFPRNE